MIEQINKYLNEINNQDHKNKEQLNTVRQAALNYVIETFNKVFDEHVKYFEKYHKRMKEQKQALEYYLDNPDPKNTCKVKSLMIQIDRKLNYNKNYIESFQITIYYPGKHSQIEQEQLKSKNIIYENYIESINRIIKQSKQLASYCKKQTLQINQLTAKCKQQIQNYKIKDWKLYKEANIKGNIYQICHQLMSMQYIQSLHLFLTSDTGIINIQDYIKLLEMIHLKRIFLKELKIGLMDMEFTQEKCNFMKLKLKNLKLIENLKINNYYSECKLGNFEDFNWHPYRKKIHIGTSKLF